jgi:phosphatidylserine/phosphatidylglycerophosphate/cardiolipin synthase-like enzyme
MLRFLSGESIVQAISKDLASPSVAHFAVAFWGKNAVRTLGLNRSKALIRIICDAYSGCCNPAELGVLLRKKSFHIKWFKGLHSKVYITPNYVVVGSANASSNGLGDESVQASNVEAAVLVSHGGFRTSVEAWFDELWRSASDLTDADMPRIRDLWKTRQRSRAKEQKELRTREAERLRRKVLNALDAKGVVLRRWKGAHDGAVIWADWYRPDSECNVIRVLKRLMGRPCWVGQY